MDKSSELDCYLYFMWNVWSKAVCEKIFSGTCHEHIWIKWMQYAESVGASGAASELYAVLDADKRKTLRDYAVRHYNKEG